MSQSTLHSLGQSLFVVAVAALVTGCADDTRLGPDRQEVAVRTGADSFGGSQVPDLGACQNLQVPAGSELAYHVYANGVQIYRWNGTTWTFVAPSAVLTADAEGNGVVGIHYAGPTWESSSGSKVVGAVVDRCTPDPNAIPWLLLEAVSTVGSGLFERVTFIQRVNTTGGLAPSDPGSVAGEEVRVPYAAEYFFYRRK